LVLPVTRGPTRLCIRIRSWSSLRPQTASTLPAFNILSFLIRCLYARFVSLNWEKICSILSALGALPWRPEAGKTRLTSSPVNGAAPGSAFCCIGQSSDGCRPAEGIRADVTPAGSVADHPGSLRSFCRSSIRPASLLSHHCPLPW
jgi:hypothetical protein